MNRKLPGLKTFGSYQASAVPESDRVENIAGINEL
jgi:hypothetical protein